MNNKYKAALSVSIILITALMFFNNCGQDFNSNSGDALLASQLNIDCTLPENVQLCPALLVLKRNCASCHAPWMYESTAEFISSGLIVPGDPGSSELLTSIKNMGGDMPPNSGALPTADFNAIVDWVTGAAAL